MMYNFAIMYKNILMRNLLHRGPAAGTHTGAGALLQGLPGCHYQMLIAEGESEQCMAEWKHCALLLLLLGIAAEPAAAHPPSVMTLVYSEQNGEVAMTVNHSVSGISVGTGCCPPESRRRWG